MRETVGNLDGKGRIPYGSRKEFQFKVLSENWLLSNGDIAAILGVTAGSVTRLRAQMRQRPEMFEVAFNDYMSLRGDPEIPKSVKYQGVIRLLVMLLDDKDKGDRGEGLNEDKERVEKALLVFAEELKGKR